MPTIAIQFTPEVASFDTVTVDGVSAVGQVATPQPSLVMIPVVHSGDHTVTPDTLALDSIPANGTAYVSGTSLVYQANDGFAGTDSFTYHAIVGGISTNIATASIRMAAASCNELGRTTRQYVSAYALARPGITRVRRMAKRCCVANFNGALPKGRQIVAARWETTSPWAILMENARISLDQRQSMVDVTFNYAGWGGLLCTVTLDNGEVYNSEFQFTVLDAPLYPSADYPTSNGPFRLDATV